MNKIISENSHLSYVTKVSRLVKSGDITEREAFSMINNFHGEKVLDTDDIELLDMIDDFHKSQFSKHARLAIRNLAESKLMDNDSADFIIEILNIDNTKDYKYVGRCIDFFFDSDLITIEQKREFAKNLLLDMEKARKISMKDLVYVSIKADRLFCTEIVK